jgi:hypothetical protein
MRSWVLILENDSDLAEEKSGFGHGAGAGNSYLLTSGGADLLPLRSRWRQRRHSCRHRPSGGIAASGTVVATLYDKFHLSSNRRENLDRKPLQVHDFLRNTGVSDG